MVQIHTTGVEEFLRLIEISQRTGQISPDAVEKLLQNETWSQLVRSYLRMEGFSQQGLKTVIVNLLTPNPVGKGMVLTKLEEGFRSVLVPLERTKLQERLTGMGQLDLSEAEETALQFLPADTPLNVHVHFTIDGFNTGMFFENHVFFDLRRVDPNALNLKFLSHEFHHVGARHWLEDSTSLTSLRHALLLG
jgi:hypothetical protein